MVVTIYEDGLILTVLECSPVASWATVSFQRPGAKGKEEELGNNFFSVNLSAEEID